MLLLQSSRSSSASHLRLLALYLSEESSHSASTMAKYDEEARIISAK
jgi:hypothetical protein